MGGLHGMAVFLRCATCSFFGVAYTGFCSFSVALRWRYFSKNAPKKWAVYTGNPFFLRFECGAVLCFCCMARGGRFWLCFLLCLGVWGAGLGLPSIGFVNAV